MKGISSKQSKMSQEISVYLMLIGLFLIQVANPLRVDSLVSLGTWLIIISAFFSFAMAIIEKRTDNKCFLYCVILAIAVLLSVVLLFSVEYQTIVVAVCFMEIPFFFASFNKCNSKSIVRAIYACFVLLSIAYNIDDNAEQISMLTAEVSRLEAYENNQAYFEEIKKKFDEEVVYTDNAPDIIEYKNWYNEMYPENAALIYRQVEEQLAMDAVIKTLADYYASMDPGSAADIFEEMTGDLEKVANILSCMKKDDAGAILAEMNSTLAAKLTLLIYPVSE